ncbi:hypothetical protein POM88_016880 [Heracleum sosnowskyi]|uniref:Uncharacterized protein n=1 Tax=Heracleum sosnowskyi TaxID=360622 RepID=A0AAD8IMU4_9APIA|nr:hypothetical protein POM88_016880 [Heracleum sosnowskyi]
MDISHSHQDNISANTRKRGRPRKDEVVWSSHTSPHVSLPQKRHVGQLESPTTTKTPQCHGTYNDPYGIGHSYDDNRNVVIRSSRHSKDNSVNLLSSFDDVNDSKSHEYGEDDMIDDENEIDENGEDFSNRGDAIENDIVMSQAHRDDMIDDENGEEFANSEDAIDNDIVASDAHRDLMGLVQNRLPMQSRNTQTCPKDVLLFDISDGSSTIKVTVWTDLAHTLNEELDRMLGQDNIIIITSCGITKYHEQLQASTLSPYKFYINPDYDAVNNVRYREEV